MKEYYTTCNIPDYFPNSKSFFNLINNDQWAYEP